MQKLRILYVGNLDPRSNSQKRFKALRLLGHEVEGLDSDEFIYRSFFRPLHYRLNDGPGVWALNKQLLKEAGKKKWDIIWVDNKPYIKGSTLTLIRKNDPGLKIINVLTDDPNGSARAYWKLSRKTAHLYDWHFVQRVENVDELISWGARNVDFCFRSFDPEFHRKLQMSKEQENRFKVEVGFIGSYEAQREDFIAYLIQNGIDVHVTGDGWPGNKHWDLIKANYHGPSVYGENYILSLNGMGVALHFLRQGNRDQQDSRTFEIPACGAFMLAEWSPLHQDFFEDRKEAVFFRTREELLEKTKYYLAHKAERDQIARAGMERCFKSGYDHQSRLRVILEKVMN